MMWQVTSPDEISVSPMCSASRPSCSTAGPALANGLGEAVENGPSIFTPASQVGDLDEAPDFWLSHGSMAIRRVN